MSFFFPVERMRVTDDVDHVEPATLDRTCCGVVDQFHRPRDGRLRVRNRRRLRRDGRRLNESRWTRQHVAIPVEA